MGRPRTRSRSSARTRMSRRCRDGSRTRGDRKSTRLNSSHSLPEAAPIWVKVFANTDIPDGQAEDQKPEFSADEDVSPMSGWIKDKGRSEEHTSELQSLPT